MKLNQLMIGLWACLLCSSVMALEFTVSDANFKQCLNTLAQKNNWENFEAITKIECHSKNILVVDGLEKFPQLESLSLYNNQIAKATLKNFPKLRQVNLAKNSLIALELAGLPMLEDLYIFNNKLVALELTQLPKLKLLKANENQILTFTYNDLPELEKIYIFNNKIVNFDIYHLPKLHYMDCRQNPMPDKLYDDMNELKGITFLHDGNAKDW
jgi:protein phosphatase 1 regulatory subunit 7